MDWLNMAHDRHKRQTRVHRIISCGLHTAQGTSRLPEVLLASPWSQSTSAIKTLRNNAVT